MTRYDAVRARGRTVVARLPYPVAQAIRDAVRHSRTSQRRRLVSGVLDRMGRAGRTVPGAARVLGQRWSVSSAGWSAVTVTGPDASGTERDTDPARDTGAPVGVGGAVTVRVPDAPALVRLAASGLLSGRVERLRVRVDRVPDWVREGARVGAPDPGGTHPSGLSWRAGGGGLDVTLSFTRAAGVSAALDAALRCVLRARIWPQAGGPVPVTDRAGWLDGSATPDQGVLLDARPVAKSSGAGPLRPFNDPTLLPAGFGPAPVDCPVGAVAFPHRRRLLGEPARYQLVPAAASLQAIRSWALTDANGAVLARFDGTRSPEAVLTESTAVRYATVELPADVWTDMPGDGPDGRWAGLVLTTLATGGLVPVPSNQDGRSLLRRLGVPSPDSSAAVTGLDGYAWSATVARTTGVLADATLRRTGLANAVGGTAPVGAMLPLPTVSILLATMRPDTVEAVLTDLAGQTYPGLEVLLGPHGWTPDGNQLARWTKLLDGPLRVVSVPPAATFGQVLASLSRTADGDVLTKVDDDDVYGPDHVSDLVLAWRQTGADLVAKAPRFVHLQDAVPPGTQPPDPRVGGGRTVDRSWAASEVFGRTPAGGTLLLSRATLLDAGGWSGSVRHVDIDLTARIRQAGGVTYRTHGLGYVYVRHARGHTWEAGESVFLEQAGDIVEGLPAALRTGRPTGFDPATADLGRRGGAR